MAIHGSTYPVAAASLIQPKNLGYKTQRSAKILFLDPLMTKSDINKVTFASGWISFAAEATNIYSRLPVCVET